MQNHSISVIVPTNRGGPYLREAIASVEKQTVPVKEIILVDDGSPAPGLDAVARDLGVTCIRQAASGISIARNTGVAVASGDWIAFLDDDDVWHPQRIEQQLRALDRDPKAIASHTGGWYMDSEGTRFGTDWSAPPGTAADMISARVAPPRITTLLIRRDVYLTVGGCDPTMEPAEDNELILRLLQRGLSAPVDSPLVGYRRHATNVTRRGLTGRIVGLRSLRTVRRRARLSHDAPLSALLTARQRVFKREAASENLGEFISAVRSRDVSYASRLVWWGVAGAPLESVRALRGRIVRHRMR